MLPTTCKLPCITTLLPNVAKLATCKLFALTLAPDVTLPETDNAFVVVLIVNALEPANVPLLLYCSVKLAPPGMPPNVQAAPLACNKLSVKILPT